MNKIYDDKLSVTILGCGSSGGVPRLSDGWGLCDPNNIKNNRLRCSILLTHETILGKSWYLIDTSPDLRQQLLKAKINYLDGVIFTHSHADHMHGIDDLRMIFFKRKSRIPIWGNYETLNRISISFKYLLEQEQGTKYPPILISNTINDKNDNFILNGTSGEILVEPLLVKHGDIDALGFKINKMAYIPDISDFYQDTFSKLYNLDILIIDALRRNPHPAHAHLEKTLNWIEKLKPKKAILTNMHNDLDYEAIKQETPENVEPAHDGLIINL